MFTGGVTTDGYDVKGAASETGEEAAPRWQVVLRRLEDNARTRVKLDAIESELILEADACDLHRHLGYSSLAELLERHLHYSRHAANERIRVARELLALPQMRAAYQAGALSFAHARARRSRCRPRSDARWRSHVTTRAWFRAAAAGAT